MAALCGCSQAPSATPVPTGISGSLPPPVTGTPALTPSSGSALQSAPATSPSSLPSGAVRVDPGLLAILPASIGGATLAESVEAEAHALTDRSLADSVERLVTAFVASPDGSNFALAFVVALKANAFSDGFYHDWRDTFDRGACSQAGGVRSSAESTIAGRAVFIGQCAGGLLTYHVYLPSANIIVSISSLGPTRFGDLLIQGLQGT